MDDEGRTHGRVGAGAGAGWAEVWPGEGWCGEAVAGGDGGRTSLRCTGRAPSASAQRSSPTSSSLRKVCTRRSDEMHSCQPELTRRQPGANGQATRGRGGARGLGLGAHARPSLWKYMPEPFSPTMSIHHCSTRDQLSIASLSALPAHRRLLVRGRGEGVGAAGGGRGSRRRPPPCTWVSTGPPSCPSQCRQTGPPAAFM
eukprot:COSAG04_NODE_251_length_18828_cov_18.990923_5_plen_200_part_00